MTEAEHRETERRRRRPAVSCTVCRRRKIRCNRETPCSNCLRSREARCVYENFSSHLPRQRAADDKIIELAPTRKSEEPQQSTSSAQGFSTSSRSNVPTLHPTPPSTGLTGKSTPTSQASVWDVQSMKEKIRELEEQLSKLAQNHPIESPSQPRSSNIETFSSSLSGNLHILHETRLPGEARAISRGITQKTRLFGQSHWINGATAVGDIFHIIEILDSRNRDGISNASSSISRCKSLARVIKSQRAPPWPPAPSTNLPSKDVTDKLVDCYLRTAEKVYRVLHVPSFIRDYEALWVADSEPDLAFLVQLKLVLAIGAAIYDEKFSLRTSAVHWVYEGQAWLADPDYKPRLLNVQSLQSSILLFLAREATGVGEESNWISAGTLIRVAMSMGLHRDPASLPTRSNFASEMRRRIWNTILELALQSSITSGGAPLISLGDFDTKPPGNFDDDQLVVDNSTPKSESEHTDISIALALRQTLPIRLAIVRFLNDLGSNGTYEETLRLDEEFRTSFKVLRRTLQSYDSSMRISVPRFEIRVVELVMYRYLIALHLPFFSPSLHGTSYAFSRKVAVETSVKIWCAVFPSSSVMAIQSRNDISSPDQDDLTRLATNGSGFFRIITTQASFVVSAELKAQLDERGLSPVPLRSDLLVVLEETEFRSFQCIEAGETSIKGYLIHTLINTQIKELMRGVGNDELPGILLKTLEEVGKKSLLILEGKVAQKTVDELDQFPLSTPSQLTDDWDFMMSDAQFDFVGMDPTSWIFNGDIL